MGTINELLIELERVTDERRAIRELYLRLDPEGSAEERQEYEDLGQEDYELMGQVYGLMEDISASPPCLSKFIALAKAIELYSFDMKCGVEDAMLDGPVICVVEQMVQDARWLSGGMVRA